MSAHQVDAELHDEPRDVLVAEPERGAHDAPQQFLVQPLVERRHVLAEHLQHEQLVRVPGGRRGREAVQRLEDLVVLRSPPAPHPVQRVLDELLDVLLRALGIRLVVVAAFRVVVVRLHRRRGAGARRLRASAPSLLPGHRGEVHLSLSLSAAPTPPPKNAREKRGFPPSVERRIRSRGDCDCPSLGRAEIKNIHETFYAIAIRRGHQYRLKSCWAIFGLTNRRCFRLQLDQSAADTSFAG